MKKLIYLALGTALLLTGCEALREIGIELPPMGGAPWYSPSPPAEATDLSAIETEILEQTNAYRQTLGMEPLAASAVMTNQARLHSNTMSVQKQISHNGFEQRIQAIAQAIRYRRAAENVAFNRGYADPATQAMDGWIDSPGHRKNLEGDFDLIGVGVIQASDGSYYFTQLFIKQR
jgi:uncharacterized protein YkwD